MCCHVVAVERRTSNLVLDSPSSFTTMLETVVAVYSCNVGMTDLMLQVFLTRKDLSLAFDSRTPCHTAHYIVYQTSENCKPNVVLILHVLRDFLNASLSQSNGHDSPYSNPRINADADADVDVDVDVPRDDCATATSAQCLPLQPCHWVSAQYDGTA
ncbi:hypothetical protein KCU61_g359, partial [Aureobasidium melanogenum]